jgi:hypothetical protein
MTEQVSDSKASERDVQFSYCGESYRWEREQSLLATTVTSGSLSTTLQRLFGVPQGMELYSPLSSFSS